MTDPDASTAYDSDFNLRARHPNFQDYFDRNEALSDQVRKAFPHHFDLAYGEHPLQTIDFAPAAQPGAPIFVFIHGGFWRSLDKRSFHFTARPFLERGYAAAHVNYRLAPEATMTEIVSDVHASIQWIQNNATRFNGNPANLHLAGHSAGGHLALMAAILRESDPRLEPADLKSVLCVSGLFDLEPVTRSYLRDDLQFDEATVQAYSPLKRNETKLTPPITFAVGEDETNEFLKQSRAMHENLNALGNESHHLVLPGFNHFDIVYELGDPQGKIATAVLDQMGEES